MNDIKIFTFIKDEQVFIRDWIDYHAMIVEYNNIYIVDNRSRDNTINILKEYEKLGINVIYDYPHYRLKGEYLSQIMKDVNDKCKYLIPIDGDEFIALKTNNKLDITADPKKIKNYIENLPYTGAKYSFYTYICCIPEQVQYNDPLIEIDKFHIHLENHEMMKKFYPSSTFISTDHGNHHGVVESDLDTIISDLVLFHYPDVGLESFVKRMYNDINGFCYPSYDIKQLQNILQKNPNIDGAHKIIQLIQYKTGELNESKYHKISSCTYITNIISQKLLEIRKYIKYTNIHLK